MTQKGYNILTGEKINWYEHPTWLPKWSQLMFESPIIDDGAFKWWFVHAKLE